MVAYVDGGSRGNPGPAGYGVRIEDGQAALAEELRGALGVATNKVAGYHGQLAALTWAAECGIPSLEVRSDSERLVKQMLGVYRVKHPGVQPLHQRARLLVARVGRVRFQHVRRTLNTEADRLANLAMDEGQETEDRSQNTEAIRCQLPAASRLPPPIARSHDRTIARSHDRTIAYLPCPLLLITAAIRPVAGPSRR